MNLFSSKLVKTLSLIFRVWLVALAVAVIAIILVIGVIAAVFSVLWSLLTVRKPAAFAVFNQFQQASKQVNPMGRTNCRDPGDASASEVVDVQTRDVSSVTRNYEPPTSG